VACRRLKHDGSGTLVRANRNAGRRTASGCWALDDRPRNANQLAEDLDLDYKTVRHHLDVLMDNDVVQRSGDDYGAVYLPTRERANTGTLSKRSWSKQMTTDGPGVRTRSSRRVAGRIRNEFGKVVIPAPLIAGVR